MGMDMKPIVLVVEDCQSDQSIIGGIIADGGFGVLVIVSELSAARELLAGNRPSLVILDLILRDERDPLTTLDTIQLTHAGTPVIVVTGCDDPRIAERAVQYHWPVLRRLLIRSRMVMRCFLYSRGLDTRS